MACDTRPTPGVYASERSAGPSSGTRDATASLPPSCTRNAGSVAQARRIAGRRMVGHRGSFREDRMTGSEIAGAPTTGVRWGGRESGGAQRVLVRRRARRTRTGIGWGAGARTAAMAAAATAAMAPAIATSTGCECTDVRLRCQALSWGRRSRPRGAWLTGRPCRIWHRCAPARPRSVPTSTSASSRASRSRPTSSRSSPASRPPPRCSRRGSTAPPSRPSAATCGCRRRDPKQLPLCAECKSIYEMYKSFNGDLPEQPDE